MRGLKTKIRLATARDADSICNVDRLTIGSEERRAYLRKAIRSKQAIVAVKGGRLVGFAIVDQSFYAQSFIRLLVTHPEFRRMGVASALIRFAESGCRTSKLFTSTNQSNKPMQNLLQKLGFVKSGYIENLDEGDPELVYFKRLRAN